MASLCDKVKQMCQLAWARPNSESFFPHREEEEEKKTYDEESSMTTMQNLYRLQSSNYITFNFNYGR